MMQPRPSRRPRRNASVSSGLVGEAQGRQGQSLPAIQEKARIVNVAQVLQEVRQ